MSNALLTQNNWLQRNWKWSIPLLVVLVLTFTLFLSLTGEHLGDFGKAYTEPQLYKGAINIAQQNSEVTELLGKLEPVGKMAILEGDVQYNDANNFVELSVRIIGTKGKARMSANARRINDSWEYESISIQIKNPQEKRQTIKVK